MAPTLTYPKTPDSTVKRHKERGTYDLETVHRLINDAAFVHISFTDPSSGFPACVPTIGKMGSFEFPSAGLDEPLDCYVHSYTSARLINLARAACADGGKGLPVCISTAAVDGILLNIGQANHSYNFRSAVVHGYAQVVTDPGEKLFAASLTTDGVLPGRSEHCRAPTRAELANVQFLRVRIVDGSAKIRAHANDDIVVEKENPDAQKEIWTGVIPVWQHLGGPVPSVINEVAEVPEHVTSFVSRVNRENETCAKNAVGRS
ncbi:hypothetical protein KEM52_004878 [Ascosphaera acerosa]|nr:hypothetical protein KEM52_004878 [Ascosphaera acerosa]